MIRCLTITLNPAVDATYVVHGFALGDANRVTRLYRMPGGKGNNVARVLSALGHRVTATGFLGGDSGAFIDAGLTAAGVTPRFVWLKDKASRTCHTVLDEGSDTATEILESGPELSGDERDELLRMLPGLAREADVAVISGSAPAGTPAAFLERLAGVVREHAARMAVDSSGPTLAALVAGRPDLIKPNETEIEALMGGPASERERLAFARDELIARRMAPNACVLISLGADGAALVTRGETWRARPPSIRPVNTVGSGDAMLAGFIDGWLAGAEPVETLRQAVAFGSAAALQPVAGVIEQDDVERLMPGVDLTHVVSVPDEQRTTI